MLIKDDKIYRNLQEQVLANKEAILQILNEGRSLNQFGLKVVGQLPSGGELPDALTYDGEFGDAYLIGDEAPFQMYVYTRPFEAEGQINPQWFNIGEFPLPGPQSEVPGPEGPQGETGERGSQWRSGLWYNQPPVSGTEKRFDQAIDGGTGELYQFNGEVWENTGRIVGGIGPRGPQGIQGPQGIRGPQGIQGPEGPQGQFIQLMGELDNINQLPDPNTVPRWYAYLVDVNGTNHIYAIIGEDTDLKWVDAGIFASDTTIRASGLTVTEYDTTYINNESTQVVSPKSVIRDNSGVTFDLMSDFNNSSGTRVEKDYVVTVPIADSSDIKSSVVNGKLQFSFTDEANAKTANSVQKISNGNILYGNDASGSQTFYPVSVDSVGSAVVRRQTNAQITVPSTPIATTDAASKDYIDKINTTLTNNINSISNKYKDYLPLSGGVMTGGLTVNGLAMNPVPATNTNPQYLVGFKNGTNSEFCPVSVSSVKSKPEINNLLLSSKLDREIFTSSQYGKATILLTNFGRSDTDIKIQVGSRYISLLSLDSMYSGKIELFSSTVGLIISSMFNQGQSTNAWPRYDKYSNVALNDTIRLIIDSDESVDIGVAIVKETW